MGTLLCCAGGFLCTAISSFTPVPNSVLKGSYYFLLFLTVVLSLVFIFYPGYSAYWITFLGEVKCDVNCGALLTNRLWFSFACLSVVQLILVFLFRDGCVFLKYCLFAGLFLASLWTSETVVDYFLWISDFAYLGYYIIQSAIVIDQCYKLNEFWRDQDSFFHLLSTTVISWLATISLLILSYYLYIDLGAPVPLLLILAIGQAVALSLFSLLPVFEEGSLLTGSLVGTYNAYLAFNIMVHVQGREDRDWTLITTGIEMFLAILLISRTTSSWSLSPSGSSDISKPLVAPADYSDSSESSMEMLAFHTVMLLASCFFATALHTVAYQSQTHREVFLWTKVTIQGATSLLYLWTLAAPTLFPDRDYV